MPADWVLRIAAAIFNWKVNIRNSIEHHAKGKKLCVFCEPTESF